METGRALEPVVLRAMQRAGWEVTPADAAHPETVILQLTPTVKVTGHPDATGRMPLFGGEAVIEVKTRGPSAFKRWQALGAERSHPDAVAQAALYTYGLFGEARDAVLAVMDTGARAWDTEVIPAERVEHALERTREWLAPLGAHYAIHGADPAVLPERDFEAGSWRCQSCPFLATCLPGDAEASTEAPEGEEPEVSDEEAREAVDRLRGRPADPARARRGEAKGPGHPEGVDAPPVIGEGGTWEPHGQPRAQHALRGRPQEAQRPPRPRGAGGDRHGADLHVGPHQLSPDASARKRQHGAASFRGGGPAFVSARERSLRYPHP